MRPHHDHQQHIGFLLLPNYSMVAFSNALEPLRVANRLAESQLYRWSIITPEGKPVRASNSLHLQPNGSINDHWQFNLLLVCTGVDVHTVSNPEITQFLRRYANTKKPLGAVCTGSYVLARAGLLNGYRCTTHWENIASMREQYPNSIVSAELYEIDRDRYTCSGGTAPLDMMLQLIKRDHGAKLAAEISEYFVCDRIRDHHDRQRIPLKVQIGTGQPKLIEAVAIMEANIEEPISLDEIGHHVGISRRQLERLFQKHLQCVPTRYYLELRLRRARELINQTSKSIVDIAFACGFVSAPHFSKCYRDMFGLPPREERRQQLKRTPPHTNN